MFKDCTEKGTPQSRQYWEQGLGLVLGVKVTSTRNGHHHSQLSASPGWVIVTRWELVLFPSRLPKLR